MKVLDTILFLLAANKSGKWSVEALGETQAMVSNTVR